MLTPHLKIHIIRQYIIQHTQLQQVNERRGKVQTKTKPKNESTGKLNSSVTTATAAIIYT